MGKLSALGTESTFSLSDFLVKVKASGAGDVIVTLQNFLNAIGSKTSNPYKFSAYRNAALSPTGVILFDTKEFDTGTNYDTSTGKFTAPVAGFYQINAQLRFTVTGSVQNVGIQLLKNGTLFKEGSEFVNMYTSSSSIAATNLSVGPVQLAANDYLQITVINSPTLALSVANGAVDNYFSGFFISAT